MEKPVRPAASTKKNTPPDIEELAKIARERKKTIGDRIRKKKLEEARANEEKSMKELQDDQFRSEQDLLSSTNLVKMGEILKQLRQFRLDSSKAKDDTERERIQTAMQEKLDELDNLRTGLSDIQNSGKFEYGQKKLAQDNDTKMKGVEVYDRTSRTPDDEAEDSAFDDRYRQMQTNNNSIADVDIDTASEEEMILKSKSAMNKGQGEFREKELDSELDEASEQEMADRITFANENDQIDKAWADHAGGTKEASPEERAARIEELRLQVETERKSFLDADYKKNTGYTRLGKILGKFIGRTGPAEKNDAELAQYRAYYDNAQMDYRQAVLEDAKLRNVSNQELGLILKKFETEARVNLADGHTQVKIENQEGRYSGFIKQHAGEWVQAYKKMHWSKKLAYGAGLGLLTIGAGVTGSALAIGAVGSAAAIKRAFTGMVSGTSVAMAGEKWGEKRQEKAMRESEQSLQQTLAAIDRGEGPAAGRSEEEKMQMKLDLVSNRTDSLIYDADNKLNKHKNWNLGSLAAGTLVGATIGSGLLSHIGWGKLFSGAKDYGSSAIDKLGAVGGTGIDAAKKLGGSGIDAAKEFGGTLSKNAQEEYHKFMGILRHQFCTDQVGNGTGSSAIDAVQKKAGDALLAKAADGTPLNMPELYGYSDSGTGSSSSASHAWDKIRKKAGIFFGSFMPTEAPEMSGYSYDGTGTSAGSIGGAQQRAADALEKMAAAGGGTSESLAAELKKEAAERLYNSGGATSGGSYEPIGKISNAGMTENEIGGGKEVIGDRLYHRPGGIGTEAQAGAGAGSIASMDQGMPNQGVVGGKEIIGDRLYHRPGGIPGTPDSTLDGSYEPMTADEEAQKLYDEAKRRAAEAAKKTQFEQDTHNSDLAKGGGRPDPDSGKTHFEEDMRNSELAQNGGRPDSGMTQFEKDMRNGADLAGKGNGVGVGNFEKLESDLAGRGNGVGAGDLESLESNLAAQGQGVDTSGIEGGYDPEPIVKEPSLGSVEQNTEVLPDESASADIPNPEKIPEPVDLEVIEGSNVYNTIKKDLMQSQHMKAGEANRLTQRILDKFSAEHGEFDPSLVHKGTYLRLSPDGSDVPKLSIYNDNNLGTIVRTPEGVKYELATDALKEEVGLPGPDGTPFTLSEKLGGDIVEVQRKSKLTTIIEKRLQEDGVSTKDSKGMAKDLAARYAQEHNLPMGAMTTIEKGGIVQWSTDGKTIEYVGAPDGAPGIYPAAPENLPVQDAMPQGKFTPDNLKLGSELSKLTADLDSNISDVSQQIVNLDEQIPNTTDNSLLNQLVEQKQALELQKQELIAKRNFNFGRSVVNFISGDENWAQMKQSTAEALLRDKDNRLFEFYERMRSINPNAAEKMKPTDGETVMKWIARVAATSRNMV